MTAQAVGSTPRATRRRVLLLAVLVSVAGVAPAILLGAVAVQLRADLGVSEGFVGMVFSGYFMVAAVTAGRGGRLADRIGWVRAVDVVAVSSTISLLAILASPTPVAFAVVVVASGTVQGLAGAVGSLALNRGLPRGQAGLAFGVMQAAVPLSSLVGGALVPAVAIAMGWQSVYAVMIVVPLAALVANRRSVLVASDRVEGTPTAGHRGPDGEQGSLRQVTLAGAVATLGNATLGAFLVASLVDAGSSESTAALGLVMASVLALVVRLVGGWLLDHRDLDGLRTTAMLSLTAAVGFALMVGDAQVLRTVGGVIAFGAGWGWSGMLLHWVAQRHSGQTGAAVGVVQRGFSTGAALGPLAAGVAVGSVGFPATWGAAALAAAAAGGVFLLAARRSTVG